MKLRCEILKVISHGEDLQIELQGTTENAAEWRSMRLQNFIVPMTKTAAKSMYIGRMVSVEIKPL